MSPLTNTPPTLVNPSHQYRLVINSRQMASVANDTLWPSDQRMICSFGSDSLNRCTPTSLTEVLSTRNTSKLTAVRNACTPTSVTDVSKSSKCRRFSSFSISNRQASLTAGLNRPSSAIPFNDLPLDLGHLEWLVGQSLGRGQPTFLLVDDHGNLPVGSQHPLGCPTVWVGRWGIDYLILFGVLIDVAPVARNSRQERNRRQLSKSGNPPANHVTSKP